MAPAAASIWEPLDRMAVVIAGSAVGMAAIANATAVRNSSCIGTPREMPRRIDAVSAKPARTRIWRVSASSCFVSGVCSATVAVSMPLMWPTWVSMPGRDDEDRAGAPGDLAVHERHVHAVAEGGVGGDRVHLLGRGDALAGEGGLVDLEGRRGEDARVGRDEVAGLDVDDVARDQLVHREIDELAVAAGLGLDGQRRAQGVRGSRRLALLVHAHHRVAQREQDEHDAGEELAGQEQADDARDEQHDLHRVRVLADEQRRARRLLGRGERVRADLRPACVGLGRGQAGVDLHALLAQRLLGAEGVPGGGVGYRCGAGRRG